jgi:hypothetical protein
VELAALRKSDGELRKANYKLQMQVSCRWGEGGVQCGAQGAEAEERRLRSGG